MPFPKTIPALADLTQDIAGPLPVDLLQKWATGTQDLPTAERLLERFRLEGHVVSTDGSGLSRMTLEQDLLEVLAAVSIPTEVVHALGTEIGGRPIGTWVADNSEMYYPAGLAPEVVLDAMNEAQVRLTQRGTVPIGMCVHTGVFYEIGQGLYGQDAQVVESLAEEYAGPGEVLVTQEVVARLRSRQRYSFAPREDLSGFHPAGVLRLARAPRMPHLEGKNVAYPHPFSPEFFDMFTRMLGPPPDPDAKARIYGQYQRQCAILFMARERALQPENTLSFLLDELVTNALMDTVLVGTPGVKEHIAASGGGLAILSFDAVPEALEFAREVRARLARNGLAVAQGIDWGPVLLLRSQGGPSGISGDPVNVASKISEELGEPGKIFVTQRAAQFLKDVESESQFKLRISGFDLTGPVL
jgi:class 3 adenylate cyclase